MKVNSVGSPWIIGGDSWGYKNFEGAELAAEYWRQDGIVGAAAERAYPWGESEELTLEIERMKVLERMIELPDAVIRECQISDIMLRYGFSCQYREGGGNVCENPEPHGEDGHWWSAHTILHERMGNGWSCLAVPYDKRYDLFKKGF